jgi:OmpA-OmpF porin, OOP family
LLLLPKMFMFTQTKMRKIQQEYIKAMRIRFVFIITFLTLKIEAQNLVLNSKFDDYIIYKDENNAVIYAPKFWHYNIKNKNHPIYYCVRRFLDKSSFDGRNIHPDYRLIMEGKTDLNYISLPVLPFSEKIYTELCDSLMIGITYKLELKIRIYGNSNCFTELKAGFSKNQPDKMNSLTNPITLHINDTITLNDLHNWVSASAEFKAIEDDKFLIIGSSGFNEYKRIVYSNPNKDQFQKSVYHNLTYLIDNVVLTQVKNDSALLGHMDSLKIGETYVLENIFFEFDKAALLENSYGELAKLSQFLMANPNTKLRIIGHTDNIGELKHNMTLSLNRAKSVVNYLISQGINNNRLQYDGKGPTEPILTNETEIGRQKNRRVEIKIIEK